MKVTKPQRIRDVLTFLKRCIACGFATSAMSSSAAAWDLGLYSYEDQVRATFTGNGLGKYTLIFGYGGCVADILNHEQSYAGKLAGPFRGEETDRVLQTVLWGVSDNANIGTDYRTRWNVNQAGTFENVHAQIVSFNIVTNQMLEIYSVNGKQWYQHVEDEYQGSQRVSQYTRYTCEEEGVLGIRTITRIPRISVSGTKQESFRAYIEHWSAFKNTSSVVGFNAVARRATSEGSPNWWYTASKMDGSSGVLPDYPNWPLTDSSLDGYAFVFNTLGVSDHTVLAMVFGKEQVIRSHSKSPCRAVLNFKHWLAPNVNPGIGILPGIYVDQALPGTLVDFEYKLIIRPGSNAEFMTQVEKAVDQVIPPRIYEPDEILPSELNKIRKRLNLIIDQGWDGLPCKAYWTDGGGLFNRFELFN